MMETTLSWQPTGLQLTSKSFQSLSLVRLSLSFKCYPHLLEIMNKEAKSSNKMSRIGNNPGIIKHLIVVMLWLSTAKEIIMKGVVKFPFSDAQKRSEIFWSTQAFSYLFCLSTLLCKNGYRYMPFRLLSTNDFESFCFHPSTRHSVFVSVFFVVQRTW